jgi:hypothetical protein
MAKVFKKAAGVVAGSAVLWATTVAIAFGQSNPGNTSVTLCDPLGNNCAPGTETFTTVTTNVISFLFTYIAIPLATIMVLVGAFQMMTSAGDPEKFTQGRKTLIYAAIGFAVAILASGITSLIKNVITGQ